MQCNVVGCEKVVRFAHGEILACEEHFEQMASSHAVDESEWNLINVDGKEEKDPEEEYSKKFEKAAPKGFAWPVMLLIAGAYTRHYRIPIGAAQNLPLEISFGGSIWSITRYMSQEGEYTLTEKTDHYKMIEAQSDFNRVHQEVKQLRNTLALAKQRLEDIAVNGEAVEGEAKQYREIADETEDKLKKAEYDRDALDKMVQKGSEERTWRFKPAELPEILKVSGIKAVTRPKTKE